MARKKVTDENEVMNVAEDELMEEIVEDKKPEAEKVPEENSGTPAKDKTYTLNGWNFTAVGEHWLSLCNPSITIKATDKALIKVAEEQVKLGVLKVVK